MPYSKRFAVSLFLALFAQWLGLSGHYTVFLTSLGLVSCLLVTWICYRMGIIDRDLLPFHLTLRTLRYVPWLTVDVLRSNYRVIRRLLHPQLPISPRVVKVHALARTEVGRVTYANSITLTPGTVTIEAEDDELTVFALSEKGQESLESGEMNRRVARLEQD